MGFLAQIPVSTSTEIGGWLVAFCAVMGIVGIVLGIAVAIKTLRTPMIPIPIAQTYVTHDEFNAFRQEIRAEIGQLKSELTTNIILVRQELAADIKDAAKEVRASNHRVSDSVNALVWGQAAIQAKMGIVSVAAPKRPSSDEELISK